MRLPRIKPVHVPTRTADGVIRIGTAQYGVGAELRDDEGSVWKLIALMDGTRELDRVVKDLRLDSPEMSEQSVHDAVRALIDAGFVEDAAAPPPPSLTATEIARYAANLRYFAWVDTTPRESPYELQRRLKESRVAVLGLGGTGSAVAMSLTAAGVGHLRCVDYDVVESANLNRQLLYTEDDVGAAKVDAAVARLRRLNPFVDVDGVSLRIESVEDVVGLLEDDDLVVLCADEPFPGIEVSTSDAAVRTGTPWLMALYAGPMVVTSLFVPYRTPCFRCFLTQYPNMLRRRNSDGFERLHAPPGNAVIAPTAALTGQLGALEAIYHLTGLPTPTRGRMFHQNLLVYDHHYYLDLEFWPDCPSCGSPVAST